MIDVTDFKLHYFFETPSSYTFFETPGSLVDVLTEVVD